MLRRFSQELLGSVLERCAIWFLCLLCFLLPLLYTPWTFEVLEGPKQFFFSASLAMIGGCFLGSLVLRRQERLVWHWSMLLFLGFMAAVVVSALCSSASYVGWIGYAGQEYTSGLTLVGATLLGLLCTQLAARTRVLRGVILSLASSVFILLVGTLLTMFEVIHFPYLASDAGFTLLGSPFGVAALATAVSVAGMGFFAFSSTERQHIFPKRSSQRYISLLWGSVWALTMILLLVLDNTYLWGLLIGGSLVAGSVALIRSRRRGGGMGSLAVPFLSLVMAGIFLGFATPIRTNLPNTLSISQTTAHTIASAERSLGVPALLFGSGPGTYAFLYDAYKPVEVNQTPFWSVRFDRARSFVWTILPTLGGIPTVLFLSCGLVLVVLWIKRLIQAKTSPEADIMMILTMALFGWHLFYGSGMGLVVLLFVGLGLSFGTLAQEGRGLLLDVTRPRTASFLHIGLIVYVILACGSVGIVAQKHVADVFFAKAIQAAETGEDPDVVFSLFSRAVRWNSRNEFYLHTLAQAEIAYARTLLHEDAEGDAEARTQKAYGLIQSAISAEQRTTVLAPENAQNWAALGEVYRSVMFSATNAEDYAAAAYTRAAQLAPTSPVFPTYLARLHLAVVQQAKTLRASKDEEVKKEAEAAIDRSLAAAETYVNQALALKTDYALARYYVASIHEERGRIPEAVAELRELLQKHPKDVGIAFEIGILELQQQHFAAAAAQLEAIATIQPDFSNGLWYLATAYENLDRVEDAIKVLRHVEELNPNNTLVPDRIARLSRGYGPEPLPEPIAEEPGVDVLPKEELSTISPP